jgi:hypothetical protein
MAVRLQADSEIQRYRTLLDEPAQFRSGFAMSTVVGLVFCGVVMMPASIYLGLMTGGDLGTAASWVTVILFMEIARRSMKAMNTQELVVLLHASHVMMMGNLAFPGGPLSHLVYRAYLVTSDAVRDAGLLGAFPTWFAPPIDSPAITERNLFHPDWWVPIGILFFIMGISLVKKYTLGYFFYRLTSDIENLPFPRAPIQALGAMALTEADLSTKTSESGHEQTGLDNQNRRNKGRRWRIFSLGAYIGIAFGLIQVGVPAISSLFLTKPFFLIPQPFIDTTTFTDAILPATPTGIALDVGILFVGFVLPFWAIMGTFAAVVITLVLNPLLHHFGILHTWVPGMDTVNTTFSNNIDFWISFNIGAGFGIAAVSIFAMVKEVTRKIRERRAVRADQRKSIWEPPRKDRGDYPIWIAILLYSVAAGAMISLILVLLPYNLALVFFLFFFAFVYNPFISYVSSRLLGMSGQRIDIPYIKETSFLLSGQQGIDIWLAPIPIDNFSQQAQSFRVNELTGVTFWSLIKTDIIALPLLFILSLCFWAFIWKADAVPSVLFPAAQINWELQAKNQALIYSSTFVALGEDPGDKNIRDTEFWKAVHPYTIGGGFFGIVVLYGILSIFGLPVMLVYGLMRGFGQFPHMRILEVVGAFVGRYYFQKKFGEKNFLRASPALLAGYLTGVGLISMTAIAIKLIYESVAGLPY